MSDQHPDAAEITQILTAAAADAAIEQGNSSAAATAVMMATHWKTLTSNGVPEHLADTLTQMFAEFTYHSVLHANHTDCGEDS